MILWTQGLAAFTSGSAHTANSGDTCVSITGSDEVERPAPGGEAYDRFVAGEEEGREIIEDAAVSEGLVWRAGLNFR